MRLPLPQVDFYDEALVPATLFVQAEKETGADGL